MKSKNFTNINLFQELTSEPARKKQRTSGEENETKEEDIYNPERVRPKNCKNI